MVRASQRHFEDASLAPNLKLKGQMGSVDERSINPNPPLIFAKQVQVEEGVGPPFLFVISQKPASCDVSTLGPRSRAGQLIQHCICLSDDKDIGTCAPDFQSRAIISCGCGSYTQSIHHHSERPKAQILKYKKPIFLTWIAAGIRVEFCRRAMN